MAREYVVFLYGAEMVGEPDHALLDGAQPTGSGSTEPVFDLVDLGARAALVPGGRTAVIGEVYTLPVGTLAALDLHAGHPILYKRMTVRLADGREAEAYTLETDQVRGKKRIRSGDWRTRNVRERITDGGPLARFARRRFSTPTGGGRGSA